MSKYDNYFCLKSFQMHLLKLILILNSNISDKYITYIQCHRKRNKRKSICPPFLSVNQSTSVSIPKAGRPEQPKLYPKSSQNMKKLCFMSLNQLFLNMPNKKEYMLTQIP